MNSTTYITIVRTYLANGRLGVVYEIPGEGRAATFVPSDVAYLEAWLAQELGRPVLQREDDPALFTCPVCGEEAHTTNEVTEVFGWRKMTYGSRASRYSSYKRAVPQSRCRACKSSRKLEELGGVSRAEWFKATEALRPDERYTLRRLADSLRGALLRRSSQVAIYAAGLAHYLSGERGEGAGLYLAKHLWTEEGRSMTGRNIRLRGLLLAEDAVDVLDDLCGAAIAYVPPTLDTRIATEAGDDEAATGRDESVMLAARRWYTERASA